MSNNLDWEEIESKISLICYKFDNLSPWHEDLAQELRMHAYYTSDNYYDLYRKAIDFWRKIQTRQSPEIPYFDLEVLNASYNDNPLDQSESIVLLVRKELERPAYSKWDKDMLDLSNLLLDIILSDVNPKLMKSKELKLNKSKLSHYINGRLNLSWVAEETDIGYKRIVVAMKFLEDTVEGLAIMKKIDVPLEYIKGYYEK